MDSLEEKIKRFLEISDGYGSGYGSGSGDGDGSGSGDGYGYGSGYGSGYGYGSGSGSGDGSGSGSGYGSGYGYGSGSGDGDGSGSGDGYGYGSGYGSGYGYGSGSGDGDGSGSGDGYGYGYGSVAGDGYGVDEIDGHKLHIIDGVPTAITGVFGNYATGFTIEKNAIKIQCYIAKVEGFFAHGETIRQAVDDATEKAMEAKPVEVRISETVKKYPDLDTDIPNTELFSLHHILTGSCEFGRKEFCKRHGIDLDGSMTMADFIKLTRNDYGGDVITQLGRRYGCEQ